jgi:hypothetical protein
MTKLNRFAALFIISLSLNAFSQIGTGGFKLMKMATLCQMCF